MLAVRGDAGALARRAPLPAGAASSTARITLNTASAVPGTQVVMRGTGWPAGAQVSIGIEHYVEGDGSLNAFDGLAQATAASDGSFIAPAFPFPFGICGVPPRDGNTAQVVAHTPDNAVRVSSPLSVARTPAFDASLPLLKLPRGATSIPVTGSAWAPGTRVTFAAASQAPDCPITRTSDFLKCIVALPGAQPVAAVAAVAAAVGTLSASVPIPPDTRPGTALQVRATATAPLYGDLVLLSQWEAPLLPLTAPTLALDRAAGRAGATIGVNGDHWPAGQTVVIAYCRGEATSQALVGGMVCNESPQGLAVTGYAQELGRAIADADGHFALRAILPPNARPGPILLDARMPNDNTGTGVYIASALFTISDATSNAKTNAAAARPSFSWWPFAAGGAALLLALGAAGYLLWRRGRLPIPFARRAE